MQRMEKSLTFSQLEMERLQLTVISIEKVLKGKEIRKEGREGGKEDGRAGESMRD